MAEAIEKQTQELERGVEAVARSVSALHEPLLLADLGRWSPRDVVAHLIGWNRYVIEGSRQILQGERPFYDLDPGEDYSKVNAVLVREVEITGNLRLSKRLRLSGCLRTPRRSANWPWPPSERRSDISFVAAPCPLRCA